MRLPPQETFEPLALLVIEPCLRHYFLPEIMLRAYAEIINRTAHGLRFAQVKRCYIEALLA